MGGEGLERDLLEAAGGLFAHEALAFNTLPLRQEATNIEARSCSKLRSTAHPLLRPPPLHTHRRQVITYVVFGHNMIAFSFLLSCFFSSSKTATVFAYLVVFGTGLIGSLLLSRLISSDLWYMTLLELVPSFALFRWGWGCALLSGCGWGRAHWRLVFSAAVAGPGRPFPHSWALGASRLDRLVCVWPAPWTLANAFAISALPPCAPVLPSPQGPV